MQGKQHSGGCSNQREFAAVHGREIDVNHLDAGNFPMALRGSKPGGHACRQRLQRDDLPRQRLPDDRRGSPWCRAPPLTAAGAQVRPDRLLESREYPPV